MYSVAGWLRDEQHIPADAARPPAQWRESLKEVWAQSGLGVGNDA